VLHHVGRGGLPARRSASLARIDEEGGAVRTFDEEDAASGGDGRRQGGSSPVVVH
jgi:hypothetical protein